MNIYLASIMSTTIFLIARSYMKGYFKIKYVNFQYKYLILVYFY